MARINVITPPAFAPVTTEEMIAHLRINAGDEDDQLDEWVSAASDYFTHESGGYVLCSQTLRLSLDWFPGVFPRQCPHHGGCCSRGCPDYRTIYLPRNPVTSVTSVQYLDTAGTWQTLSGWTADTESVPARVILPDSLPDLHPDQLPTVRVTFQAGHANAGAVPSTAKVAVKLLAAHWYANRESHSTDTIKEVPAGWFALVSRFATGIGGNWNA